MDSKVFDIIDDMEGYLNESRNVLFQPNKVIVQSDIMDEFISKIKITLPEEIKRATDIINEKEYMISAAKEKLNKIEEEANAKASQLVSEHEITRRAEAKAESILKHAYEESEEIRKEAYRYTDELLQQAQKTIEAFLNQSNNDYSKLEKTLIDQLDVIADNRGSLKEID